MLIIAMMLKRRKLFTWGLRDISIQIVHQCRISVVDEAKYENQLGFYFNLSSSNLTKFFNFVVGEEFSARALFWVGL